VNLSGSGSETQLARGGCGQNGRCRARRTSNATWYWTTTYPFDAHSCCLKVYSKMLRAHELGITMTGKQRGGGSDCAVEQPMAASASAAGESGRATLAWSTMPVGPVTVKCCHWTRN
jgi:hypothetical protein